jgi:hypothetical protein
LSQGFRWFGQEPLFACAGIPAETNTNKQAQAHHLAVILEVTGNAESYL